MIIKNAGYMWHRKYINWDSGADIIGYSEVDDKSVNFAYQAGIYLLYDHNFECVYVGQAGRGENTGLYHRLQQHVQDDYLFCVWERFSWFGFYSIEALQKGNDEAFNKEYKIHINVNKLMDVIESMIIRVHRPRFNYSLGSMPKGEKEERIEWFYQKAEFEERKAEFKRLKEICKSLRKE
jgi:hypothetical protein